MALEALTAHGITHALLVPAMLQWILAEPGARDATFPHLELIIYGAAPMPPTLLTDALRTFRCSFLQGYGLTETSGVLTVLRPEDHQWPVGDPAPARLASAGRRTHGCDVRVVRADNQPVAPGEVGEVVARGDTLMAGYYGESEATLAAYRGGWFCTGDLATVDAEGFVYIVDRQKDMIIVGGENVYPQEIETVLRQHTGVTDAAVIGIPHPTWGEEVLAFVALRVGANTTDRDLIQHCRQSLARFKCPTKVEFRGELPRNAAGKLLKSELRAPYWSGQVRQV
jgi:acyl-CoA synthetase (AMP-forming)/AMP-acid ligase II